MAAVLGGMTVLQLAQLVEALAGASASAVKIHQELKASGATTVPPTHAAQLQVALAPVLQAAHGLTPGQATNDAEAALTLGE